MFRSIGKRRRLLAAIAAIAVMSLGPRAAGAAEIAIACSALGQEQEHCRAGAQAWAERTGNTVELVSTPGSASEQLALYQQLLAAGADDIDVFQIDVVWPGILAQHFIDLAPAAGDRPARHFDAIIDNNTVEGRLVAMPWFADAGLLYFRADLLETHDRPVPETWEELTETARVIQEAERAAGNGNFWGYVWQGRAYEGLTTNALEWISSHGGGTFVDAAGEITVDNPAAVRALELAAGWVGNISPPGVLNYTEEEARGVFQSGQALFMRNWPYAWALAQSADSPVRGRVGIAVLPRGEGGSQSAALGGQQLAVSRYSAHPELAADLVMHLTSPEEQARRAIVGSFNPTIPALYDDPGIAEAVPVIAELRDILDHAVPRPSTVTGADYNRVSAAVYDAVHRVLSGRAEPEAALAGLARDLDRIKRRGWRR
ncbi:MAG TPA: ABC transporter substrate-binding protein [Aestuariivirgaceae bacterium]|nr:ABC transporter substrate-binding protein [Aestuariivirgaceae bacterium]